VKQTKLKRGKFAAINSIKGKYQLGRIFSKVLKIILFISVAAITAVYCFKDFENSKFVVDEYFFIKKSYYFDLLFIKQDISDTRWYGADSTGDVSQPKVGPYIYGLAFHLAGVKDIERALDDANFNGEMINNKPWYEVMVGKLPSSFPDKLYRSLEFLWLARKTAIVFTIGSIVAIYSLGASLKNPLFGITASFLIASNVLLKSLGKNATTDTMQLFFFSVNLLLFYKWLLTAHIKKKNKYYAYSFLLGINTALGAGVKTSGIMIVFFLAISILLVVIIEKHYQRTVKHIIIGALIISTVGSGLFYYLHPFIHNDTANTLWDMYYIRTDNYKSYWSQFPAGAITNRSQAARIIFERTLAPEGNFINYPFIKLPLDAILFVLGIIYLIYRAYKQLLIKKKFPPDMILFIWMIVVFVSLVFYLNNDWRRYYLPLVSCIAILQAYFISGGVEFSIKKIIRPFILAVFTKPNF